MNISEVIETLNEIKKLNVVFMVKPSFDGLYHMRLYGHLPLEWGFDENDTDGDLGVHDNDYEALKHQFNLLGESNNLK